MQTNRNVTVYTRFVGPVSGELRYTELIFNLVFRHDGIISDDEGFGHFCEFDDLPYALRFSEDVVREMQSRIAPDQSQSVIGMRVGVHRHASATERELYTRVPCRVAGFANLNQIVISASSLNDASAVDIGEFHFHKHGERAIYGLGYVVLLELVTGGSPTHLCDAPLSRTNLPRPPADFVGRVNDLETVRRWIRNRQNCVLRGQGGVGKTALALIALTQARAEGDIPGGVVWLNCEMLLTVSECIRTIAQVLLGSRLETLQLQDCEERVRHHLEKGDVVLMFDNFETVIGDDALHNWISELPPATCSLITTRVNPENIRAARLAVNPLSQEDSVQLFLSRARAAGLRDGFEFGGRTHKAVEWLCKAVGGLPLAIELLAARAGLIPLIRLREWFEEALTPLSTKSNVNVPERLQSFESSMEISYRMLDCDARDLLKALCILPVGPSLELLHAIAAELRINCRENLKELVRSSLIRRMRERVSCVDQWHSKEVREYLSRYTSHELIRRFVLLRFSGSERRDTENRVCRVAAGLAVKYGALTEPGKADPARALIALNWLDFEFNNLLHSAMLAVDRQDETTVWKFSSAFRYFFRVRGRLDDCLEFYSSALRLWESTCNAPYQMHTYRLLGIIRRHQGRWLDAETYFQKTLEIARDLQEDEHIGKAMNNLACVFYCQKRWDEALRYFEYDLQICKERGDQLGVGISLNNIGEVLFRLDNFADAEAFFRESLSLARALRDRVGEHMALNNLGECARARKLFAEARDFFGQSVRVQQEIGDQASDSLPLNGLGDVYLEEGKYAEAEASYRQTLVQRSAAGDPVGEGVTLQKLSLLMEALGRVDDAVVLAEQAVEALSSTDPELRDSAVALVSRLRLSCLRTGRVK